MIRWLKRLIGWWRAPTCPGAELYRVPGREEDFRHLFGPIALQRPSVDDEDRMRSLSIPRPDADFWDVAKATEQRASEPEPGRVEYRFLGVTGFEEDA